VKDIGKQYSRTCLSWTLLPRCVIALISNSHRIATQDEIFKDEWMIEMSAITNEETKSRIHLVLVIIAYIASDVRSIFKEGHELLVSKLFIL
jgi:hypothetical protein